MCHSEQKNCHVIRIRQAINKRYSFLTGQALQGTNKRKDLRVQEGNLNCLLNTWQQAGKMNRIMACIVLREGIPAATEMVL